MMDAVCTLHRGSVPLLVSLPHDGMQLPPGFAQRLQPTARRLPDTDWHIVGLYSFARDLGASILTPHYSRYVVDLNRGEDDVSLYPGQNTTGLCPATQFSGEPVYLPGQEPGEDEIRQRVETYWRPYHALLREELQRIRFTHGRAVLWEGHSIKGRLPYLFEGELPDLNLGTANGASCSPVLQQKIETVLAGQSGYTWVANGRFKGGYITRHYGDPANRIDAVQLEINQRTYMEEATFAYRADAAAELRVLLEDLLRCATAV